MPFKSKLQMEFIEGTTKYKLLKPLVYVTWKGVICIIPEGFASDGHSIPKLLRSIAGSPFATIVAKASWYHDYLCHLVRLGLMKRNKADSEYSHALSDEGWNKGFWNVFKRKRNYVGVRIGAGLGWITGLFKKKRKLKKIT